MKNMMILTITTILLLTLVACGDSVSPQDDQPPAPPPTDDGATEDVNDYDDPTSDTFIPDFPLRDRLPRPDRDFSHMLSSQGAHETTTYMAAEATISGSLEIMSSGSVGRFEQRDRDDMLEFTVEVGEEGFYQLEFDVMTHGGYKENFLTINGASAGKFSADSEDFAPASVRRVFLEAGTHTIAITAEWGWIEVMSLTVASESDLDPSFFDIPITLINPHADENALGLMSFLAMQYGLVMLSGQQSQGDRSMDNGLFGAEAQFIYEMTGKRPAVIGLDMMDYSPSRVERGERSTEVEAAIEAWENNAIVTFCWHWNAPTPYIDGTWYRAFYTNDSQRGFFKRIMDGDDPDGFQMLIDDIDAIAYQLTRLRDAGVPVLWRPLHEASGGWFWWGTDRESYLELWKIMYDRLTNYHHLTNLIWLWNGQHADWYPGDEYVDIIGEDIYAAGHDHSSQSSKFFEAAAYTDAPKMLVLSENGALIDPELARRDGAMWGYWCVWNGEFVRTEEHTTFEMLRHIYDSPLVLTLEDLPDLKTYPVYVD